MSHTFSWILCWFPFSWKHCRGSYRWIFSVTGTISICCLVVIRFWWRLIVLRFGLIRFRWRWIVLRFGLIRLWIWFCNVRLFRGVICWVRCWWSMRRIRRRVFSRVRCWCSMRGIWCRFPGWVPSLLIYSLFLIVNFRWLNSIFLLLDAYIAINL